MGSPTSFYQFLAGEEGGLTPCRMKNKTCQSAGELTVSQQPLSKSWLGVTKVHLSHCMDNGSAVGDLVAEVIL